MNRSAFAQLMEVLKAERPSLFMLPTDPCASESSLNAVEVGLGAQLPDDYRWFLSRYGGGDFAFSNFFSAAKSSEWNIVHQNSRWVDRTLGFVGISDDQCGGFFGFRVEEARCQPQIHYLDLSTLELTATRFGDVLSFIASTGLRHETT